MTQNSNRGNAPRHPRSPLPKHGGQHNAPQGGQQRGPQNRPPHGAPRSSGSALFATPPKKVSNWLDDDSLAAPAVAPARAELARALCELGGWAREPVARRFLDPDAAAGSHPLRETDRVRGQQNVDGIVGPDEQLRRRRTLAREAAALDRAPARDPPVTRDRTPAMGVARYSRDEERRARGERCPAGHGGQRSPWCSGRGRRRRCARRRRGGLVRTTAAHHGGHDEEKRIGGPSEHPRSLRRVTRRAEAGRSKSSTRRSTRRRIPHGMRPARRAPARMGDRPPGSERRSRCAGDQVGRDRDAADIRS